MQILIYDRDLYFSADTERSLHVSIRRDIFGRSYRRSIYHIHKRLNLYPSQKQFIQSIIRRSFKIHKDISNKVEAQFQFEMMHYTHRQCLLGLTNEEKTRPHFYDAINTAQRTTPFVHFDKYRPALERVELELSRFPFTKPSYKSPTINSQWTLNALR